MIVNKIVSLLENNYKDIFDEYKNFNFDDKHGLIIVKNSYDIFYENWKKEYILSFKRIKHEQPKNIKTVKKYDYWYAYEYEGKLAWESVLLAYRWNNNLYLTDYATNFFPYFLELIGEQKHISKIALAKLLPNGKVPLHKGDERFYRIHLGLIIPTGDVKFQVNEQIMSWENGKCLLFKDSDKHMAWNNTEYDRIVLIVDVVK